MKLETVGNIVSGRAFSDELKILPMSTKEKAAFRDMLMRR